MANETTYSLISSLVPTIWEAALWYAEHRFAMPGRVTLFSDATGIAPRKISDYRETGNAAAVAETAEVPKTAMNRALLATLTPSEIAKRVNLTDIRVETDTENVFSDAARDLGYAVGRKVESDVIANIQSFTGGTTGGASAFDLNKVFAARAILEANAIPGPYTVVLHPYHYLDIFTTFLDSTKPANQPFRTQALQSYYIPGIADMEFVISTLLPRKVVYTHTIGAASGTYTIYDNITGTTTTALAFDANAAAITAALDTAFGTNVYEVTGTGPWTITAQDTGLVSNGHELRLLTTSLAGGTASSLVEASATAHSAVFTRDALALDLRRGLRIEAERSASYRATDLVATMVYATGLWRSERGVRVLADATTPSVA